MLTINGGAYVIYDLKGKEAGRGSGNGGNQTHLQNFVDAIRGEKSLNADIQEGHKSTLLCHLGNISYRTGHTIHFDPKTCKILNDPAAARLWGRQYQKGWEPRA